MLNVQRLIALPYSEIRCVRLIGIENMVLIEWFVFVIDVVQIQEIRDANLFKRPDNLVAESLNFLCFTIDYFLDIFAGIALQCGKIGFGDIEEEIVQIISFERCIEI
jgi:hypothetical protein